MPLTSTNPKTKAFKASYNIATPSQGPRLSKPTAWPRDPFPLGGGTLSKTADGNDKRHNDDATESDQLKSVRRQRREVIVYGIAHGESPLG